MAKLEFCKLQASGNDFILIDRILDSGSSTLDYKKIAKKYCQRKMGIGADGLLVIEPSRKADFRMRIFNADGSEAEMCGNGARCAALWRNLERVKFETKAGLIESNLKKSGAVSIKVTDPFGLKLDLPLKVLGRRLKVNFVNTGVPHAVIFVEGLEKIDVGNIGRAVRFHHKFSPAGANANFVEVLNKDFIKIRTYERGVEAETLACGTGVVASAITANCRLQAVSYKGKVKVLTRGGETLRVHFNRNGDKIKDVWLQGKAHRVYKGELYY